ncbi:MAG: hypothetical protein IPK08_19655 [Bacteroidetes bacterium]|nr:hypothetical protein [Bacteroidota bacterium]
MNTFIEVLMIDDDKDNFLSLKKMLLIEKEFISDGVKVLEEGLVQIQNEKAYWA